MTTVNQIEMLDIRDPEIVGIQFTTDGRMWVCVDGICRLRIRGTAVVKARAALIDDLMRQETTDHDE